MLLNASRVAGDLFRSQCVIADRIRKGFVRRVIVSVLVIMNTRHWIVVPEIVVVVMRRITVGSSIIIHSLNLTVAPKVIIVIMRRVTVICPGLVDTGNMTVMPKKIVVCHGISQKNEVFSLEWRFFAVFPAEN